MTEIKHMPVPEFNPPVTLLVKLGSIAVHAEELLSPAGHAFDRTALEQLLNDPEVRGWIGGMSKMAMLPVKRTPAAALAARVRAGPVDAGGKAKRYAGNPATKGKGGRVKAGRR